MSTVEAGLRARLIADPQVAALAMDRVSWVQRPQEDKLPAVTLQTVGAARRQTFGGVGATQQARVQADVWATTHVAAAALREAVIAALLPAAEAGGFVFQRAFAEVRETGEQGATRFVHRQIIDFRFTYSPAA